MCVCCIHPVASLKKKKSIIVLIWQSRNWSSESIINILKLHYQEFVNSEFNLKFVWFQNCSFLYYSFIFLSEMLTHSLSMLQWPDFWKSLSFSFPSLPFPSLPSLPTSEMKYCQTDCGNPKILIKLW